MEIQVINEIHVGKEQRPDAQITRIQGILLGSFKDVRREVEQVVVVMRGVARWFRCHVVDFAGVDLILR